jgi:DNA-binding FadR family transcriptional regulator
MVVSHPQIANAPRARSAHDLVTHGIGRAILEGRFAVGSTLPGDAQLMERFGVSRTALREAMKTLAAKGLIESKTKVGTRVLGEKNWNMFDADILSWRLQLGVDRAFLESLFEIRQTLEPLAAASAASYRSEEDLQLMKAALDAMRLPHHTRDSFTRADVAYHRAILDASANPFLQSIGSVIEAALATAFTLSSPIDSPDRFELSRQQHGAIFDAIVRRDPQAASNAMSVVIVQGAKGAGIHRSDASSVAITIKLFGN